MSTDSDPTPGCPDHFTTPHSHFHLFLSPFRTKRKEPVRAQILKNLFYKIVLQEVKSVIWLRSGVFDNVYTTFTRSHFYLVKSWPKTMLSLEKHKTSMKNTPHVSLRQIARLDLMKRGRGINGRDDRSSGIEIRMAEALAKINPTDPLILA
jgi:hypothetical protein